MDSLPRYFQDPRSLAEAIILQSVEDLFSSMHRKGSLEFFNGEGFLLSADIANIKFAGRMKLLKLVKNTIKRTGLYQINK